jgi:hypothetical protein
LKQTTLLQSHTKTDRNDTLPNVVRYRFRRDRKLISLKQVANGLNAGYAMLDLVHACNNKNGDALTKLATLVESTTVQAEQTAAWRSTLGTLKKPVLSSATTAKVGHINAVADKANQVRHPGSKPILDRPLPLSEIRGGTRRVPNLVTAHGIPFLRYSKPQPISLSRVIRQKVLWNEKNWIRRGVLEEKIILAEFEDEWDRILEREHGITDADPEDATATFSEPSWTEEFHNNEAAIFEAIRARDAKCAEIGEKMWEIVKQEKALKRLEKTERRVARKEMELAKEGASLSAGQEADLTEGGPLYASSGKVQA